MNLERQSLRVEKVIVPFAIIVVVVLGAVGIVVVLVLVPVVS